MESKHNLLSEASKIVAQVLPHSYDTEKDLLGQIILNNKVIDEVLPYLPSDDVFYNRFHRSIWRGIIDLRSKGDGEISINALVSEVPPSLATKEIGYQITGLCENVATTANAVVAVVCSSPNGISPSKLPNEDLPRRGGVPN